MVTVLMLAPRNFVATRKQTCFVGVLWKRFDPQPSRKRCCIPLQRRFLLPMRPRTAAAATLKPESQSLGSVVNYLN
ncbi:MAG: hypothetical protein ACK55Z_13530 [bacterium]